MEIKTRPNRIFSGCAHAMPQLQAAAFIVVRCSVLCNVLQCASRCVAARAIQCLREAAAFLVARCSVLQCVAVRVAVFVNAAVVL